MVWSLVLKLKRRGSDVLSNDPYHHLWGGGVSDGDDDSDDQPNHNQDQSDKRMRSTKAIATTPKCYQFHQNSYIYF